MLLLIDNYDSFVHNLARYFERLGQATRVVRNDCITPDGIHDARPEAIILSPGPCSPREAGASLDIVRELHALYPMLGVCLGHQTIAAALGGDVVRAPEPVHGRASKISHDGRGLFEEVPNPLSASRYHSLVVDRNTLPAALEVTASISNGLVMAIRHRTLPVFGLQFHPESILTCAGFQLLANFLRLAGCDAPPAGAMPDGELRQHHAPLPPLPSVPVTF